jgi:hypothetical protein
MENSYRYGHQMDCRWASACLSNSAPSHSSSFRPHFFDSLAIKVAEECEARACGIRPETSMTGVQHDTIIDRCRYKRPSLISIYLNLPALFDVSAENGIFGKIRGIAECASFLYFSLSLFAVPLLNRSEVTVWRGGGAMTRYGVLWHLPNRERKTHGC